MRRSLALVIALVAACGGGGGSGTAEPKQPTVDEAKAEKEGGANRAVSGIFAGKQCTACHERPGEILGAFSYRLALEDPPAKPVGSGFLGRP
jgi:cytochrome c5